MRYSSDTMILEDKSFCRLATIQYVDMSLVDRFLQQYGSKLISVSVYFRHDNYEPWQVTRSPYSSLCRMVGYMHSLTFSVSFFELECSCFKQIPRILSRLKHATRYTRMFNWSNECSIVAYMTRIFINHYMSLENFYQSSRTANNV
jgi:hypothetical protein